MQQTLAQKYTVNFLVLKPFHWFTEVKYHCFSVVDYLVLVEQKSGVMVIVVLHVHVHDAYVCLAETDLVLPLIRQNPSCLDVKNNDGLTARELLQDFKDHMKRKEQHHQPEVLN